MRNVRALIKAIRDIKQALCELDAGYHCGEMGLTAFVDKRNQMRGLLHSCEQRFIAECIAIFEKRTKRKVAA